MKRWLVFTLGFTLGLGVAAIAGWSLLTGGEISRRPRDGATTPAAHATHTDLHENEIDQASRDQLRAILREADENGVGAP